MSKFIKVCTSVIGIPILLLTRRFSDVFLAVHGSIVSYASGLLYGNASGLSRHSWNHPQIED